MRGTECGESSLSLDIEAAAVEAGLDLVASKVVRDQFWNRESLSPQKVDFCAWLPLVNVALDLLCGAAAVQLLDCKIVSTFELGRWPKYERLTVAYGSDTGSLPLRTPKGSKDW